MATTTTFIHDDVSKNDPDKEKYGRILRNVTWRSDTAASAWRGESSSFDSISELTSKRKQAAELQRISASICSKEIQSTPTKRSYSEVEDHSGEARQSKRRKPAVERERFTTMPIEVYGHKCLGILFTASSIGGSGTTVFSVVKDKHNLEDKHKLLALRMAWQDLAREEEQNAIMERLKEKPRHPNVIVPVETFKAERNGKTCTTLEVIRDLFDDQIEYLGVDNRVLTTSKSELKRPVRYFWGVHDFVRGLRGALLGHQYLTAIGILHRDISENNIVLGLRPENERGYLIDFDLAILQDREEPTESKPVEFDPLDFEFSKTTTSAASPGMDIMKHHKALRTGTFPYMSHNVLSGGTHTQFDDVESFLYVLLLFFFSYAGPLPASELEAAHETGFVRSIGAGRPSHMRSWPKQYVDWADGDAKSIAKIKLATILTIDEAKGLTQEPNFLHCLQSNWPAELHEPISQLIDNSFTLFYYSMLSTQSKGFRSEVSHEEFIAILDKWLKAYAHLEDKYSNCPFKEAEAQGL